MKAQLYKEPTYYDAITKASALIGVKPEDIDKKILVFAPEKATLTIERKIAAIKGGFMNVRVFSFGKFLKYFGSAEDKVLSKEASVMLIGKILSETDKLKCFTHVSGGFAENLYDSISLLKSAKITPEEIKDVCLDEGVLKDKINDLYTVYSLYEDCLSKNNYKDENGMLSAIPSLIKSYRDIQNTEVYLVGYDGWTASARNIIETLILSAKSVTAVCVGGSNGGVYTNETPEAFMKICAGLKVSLSVGGETAEAFATGSGKIDNPHKNEADGSDKEKQVILERMYSEKAFNLPVYKTDKIVLEEKQNLKEELKEIAKIVRLGVINGRRFKDYTVALPDPGEYYDEIEEIFTDYGVPYYADVKKKFSSHPISRLVLTYLDVLRKNCSQDNVLALVKNPFFAGSNDLTDRFENYVLKYDLNYSRFLSPLPHAETVPDLEELRKKFASLIPEKKPVTAGGFAKLTENFITNLNVEEKLEDISERLIKNYPEEAEYAKGALKTLKDTLFYVNTLIPDLKTDVKEFKTLLSSGLSSAEVSIIPQKNDAVYIGGYKDVGNGVNKILFFPGLNDGVPEVKQDIAVLSDRELSALAELKVIIEPKVKTVNAREREIFCTALTSFTEKLYLSYSVENLSGGQASGSDALKYLRRSFGLKKDNGTAVIRSTDEAVLIAERFISPSQAEKRFALETGRFKDGLSSDMTGAASYYYAIENMDDEDMKKRADNLLSGINSEIGKYIDGGIKFSSSAVSVSRIESFYACPFKWFMERCAGITEREEGKLKPRDSGNVIHLAAELFVKAYMENEVTDENFNEVADKVIDGIFSDEEVKKFYSEPGSASGMERLKTEIKRVLKAVYRQFTAGSFRPLGAEVEFGKKDSKYPPLVLNTKNGDYKVCGKVDRIDKYKNYYRIIDYKTGADKVSDKELFMGKKLQLYLYLKAFGAEGTPVGAYYASIADKFSSADDEKFYLSGNTLSEEEAIVATDSGYLVSDSSDIIGVKYRKGAGGTRKLSSAKCFKGEDISSRSDYSKAVAEKGVGYMNDGFIAATPFSEGGKLVCAHCPFGAVCGFEDGLSGKVRQAEGLDITSESFAGIDYSVASKTKTAIKKERKEDKEAETAVKIDTAGESDSADGESDD